MVAVGRACAAPACRHSCSTTSACTDRPPLGCVSPCLPHRQVLPQQERLHEGPPHRPVEAVDPGRMRRSCAVWCAGQKCARHRRRAPLRWHTHPVPVHPPMRWGRHIVRHARGCSAVGQRMHAPPLDPPCAPRTTRRSLSASPEAAAAARCARAPRRALRLPPPAPGVAAGWGLRRWTTALLRAVPTAGRLGRGAAGGRGCTAAVGPPPLRRWACHPPAARRTTRHPAAPQHAFDMGAASSMHRSRHTCEHKLECRRAEERC